MREELLQERKKAIYGLICDELYVPMKAKEIAAVLNVPKSDRRDLAEVPVSYTHLTLPTILLV